MTELFSIHSINGEGRKIKEFFFPGQVICDIPDLFQSFEGPDSQSFITFM